jgi:flagellar biosynthesis/type III secretory pathway protein FliH
MSALIKSAAAAGAARPFAAVGASHELNPAREPGWKPAERLLEERIAALEAELAGDREAVSARLAEAREQGAREALETRSDAEEQALAALEAALGAALEQWRERLASWDRAAAGIARAVLEQVFVADEQRAALVESAIARKLAALNSASLVEVRVSAEDFGEARALEAAAARLGRGVRLAGDPALRSGECLVDLKLGHADLGLGGQWRRIEALLERLEREGGEA